MQHHEIRMAPRHRAQLRQRYRAVAAHRDRDRARFQDGADAGLDQRIGRIRIAGMAGNVAHVDRTQKIGRIVDAVAAEDVDGTQQSGLLADGVRPLARSHAERMRAAIERDAHHAGAGLARACVTDRRQAHESRYGMETDFG
ncbi:hypothetical protein D3C85_1106870 [compost metagenome]